MDTHVAIAYFGSQAQLARALGLTRQAVSAWGDRVPELRALQLERLTGGRLKYDEPPRKQAG